MPLQELYRSCDILSIHVPVTAETKNMVDKRVFECMKSTSIVINTARGEIVNQQDLYNAIVSRQIAGAGRIPYVLNLSRLTILYCNYRSIYSIK